MSHNTGVCKVNSPIECEYIENDFDQYDELYQWSKNRVTKIKVEICQCVHRNVKIAMCADSTYFPPKNCQTASPQTFSFFSSSGFIITSLEL